MGKPSTWRRSPASQPNIGNGRSTPGNTDDLWPGFDEAEPQVLHMQAKLQLVAVSAVSRSRPRKPSRSSASLRYISRSKTLRVERGERSAKASLLGPKVGHPGPQLVEGEKVSLIAVDETLDALGGAGETRASSSSSRDRSAVAGQWRRAVLSGAGRVRPALGSANNAVTWFQTRWSR